MTVLVIPLMRLGMKQQYQSENQRIEFQLGKENRPQTAREEIGDLLHGEKVENRNLGFLQNQIKRFG